MKPFAEMTEPEIREHLKKLARTIEQHLPPGPGPRGHALFVLLIFDEEHIGQYLSNAQRDGIIKSLREFADVLEKKEDVTR